MTGESKGALLVLFVEDDWAEAHHDIEIQDAPLWVRGDAVEQPAHEDTDISSLPARMQIDAWSDVACPGCAIGRTHLE